MTISRKIKKKEQTLKASLSAAYYLTILLLYSCGSIVTTTSTSTPPKIFEDELSDNLKTAMILEKNQSRFKTDISSFHYAESEDFKLIFDDLSGGYQQYNLTIIHCNVDWTKSSLNDLEFLESYNEFEFYDYDYSLNTKVSYTQYSVGLPKLKQPGNYILAVYKDNNTDHFELTRRIVAYDNGIMLSPDLKPASDLSKRLTHHQLDFKMDYRAIESNDPIHDFTVVLRQNFRWDNALSGIKPVGLDPVNKQLDFSFFDLDNSFPSTKEFRYFDARSYIFHGRRIVRHQKDNAGVYNLYVEDDKPRNGLGYLDWKDMNGRYFVENTHPNAAELEEDYFQVHFRLNKAPQLTDEKIYVVGGFNNWNRTPETVLKPSEDGTFYGTNILMKQGFYDYMYISESENEYQHEGLAFEAENEYEIIIYFRDPVRRYDKIVGYYHQIFKP